MGGRSELWEITATPNTREAISVSPPPTASCDATGAVRTADGRTLSSGQATMVPGPGAGTPLTASSGDVPA